MSMAFSQTSFRIAIVSFSCLETLTIDLSVLTSSSASIKNLTSPPISSSSALGVQGGSILIGFPLSGLLSPITSDTGSGGIAILDGL